MYGAVGTRRYCVPGNVYVLHGEVGRRRYCIPGNVYPYVLYGAVGTRIYCVAGNVYACLYGAGGTRRYCVAGNVYVQNVLYAETMLLTISHSNKNFLNCDRNYAALTQT